MINTTISHKCFYCNTFLQDRDIKQPLASGVTPDASGQFDLSVGSDSVLVPATEPLTMDVVQVRPWQAVVQHDRADRPAQQGQNDQRLKPPEPPRRVNQRGQNNSPQHVAHHRHDGVVEQVGRTHELRLGIGGVRHVVVEGVAELAVEDRAREQQSEHHTPHLPLPTGVPPLATRRRHMVDRQPEGGPDSETHKEIARENTQVLLERVCHATLKADGDELRNEQHDQRGHPRRPTRTCQHPSQSRNDAEVTRRMIRRHVHLRRSNEQCGALLI